MPSSRSGSASRVIVPESRQIRRVQVDHQPAQRFDGPPHRVLDGPQQGRLPLGHGRLDRLEGIPCAGEVLDRPVVQIGRDADAFPLRNAHRQLQQPGLLGLMAAHPTCQRTGDGYLDALQDHQRYQHERDQVPEQRVCRIVDPRVVVVRLERESLAAGRHERHVHLDVSGTVGRPGVGGGFRGILERRADLAVVDGGGDLGRCLDLFPDLVGVVRVQDHAVLIPDGDLGEIPVDHPVGDIPIQLRALGGGAVDGAFQQRTNDEVGEPDGHPFGIAQRLCARHRTAGQQGADGHHDQRHGCDTVDQGQLAPDADP